MHKRKEIKDAAVAMLRAGLTHNIYKNRYLSISPRNFPAISVYCPDETSELNASQELYDRTARVVVAAYVLGKDEIELEASATEDIDDKLDSISTEIEEIFNTQYQNLGKAVYSFELTSTQYFVNAEGNEIVGVAILEYNANYKDSL